MSNRIALDAVQVHAEGEPGRILTDAAGLVQGGTMAERLAYCRTSATSWHHNHGHRPL